MTLKKKYINSMAYSQTMDKPIRVCEDNIEILKMDGLNHLFNADTKKKPSKSNRGNGKGTKDLNKS